MNGAGADLAPMEWGEIVSRGVALYRQAFGKLYVLALVPVAINFGISTAMQSANGAITQALVTHNTSQILGIAGPALVGLVVSLVVLVIVQAFQEGSLTLAASWIVLGEEAPLSEAVRGTLYRLGSLTLASLAYWIVLSATFCLLCLPGIFSAIAFSLLVPAVVLDDHGPIDGMTRSFRLVLTSTSASPKPFLKAFLVLLIAFAFSAAIGIIAVMPGVVAAMAWGISMGMKAGSNPMAIPTVPIWIMAVTGIWQVPVTALAFPFSAVVRVLLYYDLKLRWEGEELETAPA